jgi:nitroimidazol reductase NimA-like FMN-containing flavoprotein (pyridoxamine 5'-phosphate oxidase superfamily)
MPWTKARRWLSEAEYYWLATVNPRGGPHVVPVLAVWMEGAMYFCANPTSRKARNLDHEGCCVLTAEHHKLHLVVEGSASRVNKEEVLRNVAQAYATKYGWPVSIRGGAFYAEGAPTAGPPPYQVFRVEPEVIFGFGTDDKYKATRWRF